MDRQSPRRATLAAAFVLFSAPLVLGKDMVVSTTGARETYDCAGDGIVINGSDNTITLRDCDKVSINGADNRVNAGNATKISVLGSGNKVTYTRGDRDPKVLNMGVGNTVTAGASREDARPEKKSSGRDASVVVDGGSGTVVVDRSGKVEIGGPGGAVTVDRDGGVVKGSQDDRVLADDRQTGTHNCHGGKAVVTGDRNTFSFRDCAKVVVSGDRNTVDTRGAEAIDVSGDRNTVTWRGDRPRISDSGDHNTIAGK